MNRCFVSYLMALCLCVAGLVGCGNAEQKKASGKTLHLGNGAEPQMLDPHTMNGTGDQRVAAALYEGLIQLNTKTLAPEPAAAASWEISPDGKVYTFTLRPGLKWSNGDPLTTRDFIWSWKRELTPALACKYAYFLHGIHNARAFSTGKITDFSAVGVKALDDTKLEITLDNPTPYFLSLLYLSCFAPVHQATVEKFGKFDDPNNLKWTEPGNSVCNGAFKMEVWKPNQVIRVVRNPQYWDAASVKSDAIEFYPIDNAMTEERMFRSGELHRTQTVLPAKVEAYRAKNDPVLRLASYLGTYYYKLNLTRKPLDDKRVRRALAMSINRDAIVSLQKGGQKPAGCFTPPDTAGYTCRTAIPYDVEKAKALLAEAGYPGGKGLPPIELLYNTQEGHKLIAEAIQNMWKSSLGVDVTLSNQDWKVFLGRLKDKDYAIARSSWIGDYADPTSFLDCYRSDSGINQSGFSSKQYDALLDEAASTTDSAKRLELLQQAEAILLDEAAIIPIYHYVSAALSVPELKGWDSNILDYVLFKQLSLEEK
jgi:oligopeptide transport system substrate-binding protein